MTKKRHFCRHTCQINLFKGIPFYIEVILVNNNSHNYEGTGWFRRFKTQNPTVRFVRKGKEDDYKYDKIGLPQWATDNERYILENNDGNLCTSPDSIILVEGQELVWQKDSRLAFKVMVRIFQNRCYSFIVSIKCRSFK